MNVVRARLVVTMKRCALVATVWLLSVTCTAASPITIGTFSVQNDPLDLTVESPIFQVFNFSGFSSFPATFGDIHLLFDLQDRPSLDFSLDGLLGPVGDSFTSNGLANLLSLGVLPDLSIVVDAYLTLTVLDAVTNAILPGTLSFGPTDPAMCDGCTSRLTDFRNGSSLAIQFDPSVPGDAAPVPEPMSLLLVGSGLAASAAAKRWRTR